jgi:hypothetical protein
MVVHRKKFLNDPFPYHIQISDQGNDHVRGYDFKSTYIDNIISD